MPASSGDDVEEDSSGGGGDVDTGGVPNERTDIQKPIEKNERKKGKKKEKTAQFGGKGSKSLLHLISQCGFGGYHVCGGQLGGANPFFLSFIKTRRKKNRWKKKKEKK